MRCLNATLGLLVCFCTLGATADEFAIESAGIRWGLGANESSRHFNQFEAAVNYSLPWASRSGSGCWVQTMLQFSAGGLTMGEDCGAVFTVGPMLRLGRGSFPAFLEGGLSPTLLTRSHFTSKDFSIPFQVTSHVGLGFDLARHVRFGYRYQHMSNVRLGSTNPGLNLHVVGFAYRF